MAMKNLSVQLVYESIFVHVIIVIMNCLSKLSLFFFVLSLSLLKPFAGCLPCDYFNVFVTCIF